MKKILIIEDDEFVADIYREVLETEGFEVTVCGNGTTAMDLLQSSAPQLVLLDILLPGTGGAEVLSFIRSQPATRTLPVIVMSNASAYADDLIREMRMQGANACLTKAECTPGRLLREVRSVLAAAAAAEPEAKSPADLI